MLPLESHIPGKRSSRFEKKAIIAVPDLTLRCETVDSLNAEYGVTSYCYDDFEKWNNN